MADKSEMPSQAEFGLLIAYLARQGVSEQWIDTNIDSNKTRTENAEMLKLAMKELI